MSIVQGTDVMAADTIATMIAATGTAADIIAAIAERLASSAVACDVTGAWNAVAGA